MKTASGERNQLSDCKSFFFSNCEGFHLSNEGFFSWLPLLVLVSFGCPFKFLGFQKKLSFESGDYFPKVIVLVIILCQFFATLYN